MRFEERMFEIQGIRDILPEEDTISGARFALKRMYAGFQLELK